jgi:hypothetical protein
MNVFKMVTSTFNWNNFIRSMETVHAWEDFHNIFSCYLNSRLMIKECYSTEHRCMIVSDQ